MTLVIRAQLFALYCACIAVWACHAVFVRVCGDGEL